MVILEGFLKLEQTLYYFRSRLPHAWPKLTNTPEVSNWLKRRPGRIDQARGIGELGDFSRQQLLRQQLRAVNVLFVNFQIFKRRFYRCRTCGLRCTILFLGRSLHGFPLRLCNALLTAQAQPSIQKKSCFCVVYHPLQALLQIHARHGTAGHDGPLVSLDRV